MEGVGGDVGKCVEVWGQVRKDVWEQRWAFSKNWLKRSATKRKSSVKS